MQTKSGFANNLNMRIYRQIVLFQRTFAQILSNSKRAENQALNISFSLCRYVNFFLFMFFVVLKRNARATTNEFHFAIKCIMENIFIFIFSHFFLFFSLSVHSSYECTWKEFFFSCLLFGIDFGCVSIVHITHVNLGSSRFAHSA